MTIEKRPIPEGTYRQGTLPPSPSFTPEAQVRVVLGEPNAPADPPHVRAAWEFYADGKPCAVWLWRRPTGQEEVHYYGPHEVIAEIFREKR